MSRRKRALIAFVVIELLLAGGWLWLHGLATMSPHAAPDSARVIGDVFGGAMGFLLALSSSDQRSVLSATNPAVRCHPRASLTF